MLAHALTSSGLFLCIGSLYDKYGTRILRFYGGLFHTAPLFSTIFMIFSLANLGLPGTSNFVGEFLIFVNCFNLDFGALYGLLVVTIVLVAKKLRRCVLFRALKVYLFYQLFIVFVGVMRR